jgi:dsRNA-specific ribonuclease
MNPTSAWSSKETPSSGAASQPTSARNTPSASRDFLTDARKVLVNNECIGGLSKHLGLEKFYVISRHNEESPAIAGRANLKKLGDIFEAFLGALWTDCGQRFQIVYTFVTTVLEAYLDIEDSVAEPTNYKDSVSEVLSAGIEVHSRVCDAVQ